VGPGQYGVTVARVAAVTYSKPADDPSLLISGIGRAEAMAYRDARGQAMTDLDWSEIECRLQRRLPVPEGGGWGRQPLTYCRPFLVAQLLRDTKKPRTMPGLLSC